MKQSTRSKRPRAKSKTPLTPKLLRPRISLNLTPVNSPPQLLLKSSKKKLLYENENQLSESLPIPIVFSQATQNQATPPLTPLKISPLKNSIQKVYTTKKNDLYQTPPKQKTRKKRKPAQSSSATPKLAPFLVFHEISPNKQLFNSTIIDSQEPLKTLSPEEDFDDDEIKPLLLDSDFNSPLSSSSANIDNVLKQQDDEDSPLLPNSPNFSIFSQDAKDSIYYASQAENNTQIDFGRLEGPTMSQTLDFAPILESSKFPALDLEDDLAAEP